MQTKADQFRPELAAAAEGAKVLSHPARLAILEVLSRRDSCICGEIVDELPLAQATVSRHLKVLKEAGLIVGTIEGPSVCYCIDRDALVALDDVLDGLLTDILERAPEQPTC